MVGGLKSQWAEHQVIQARLLVAAFVSVLTRTTVTPNSRATSAATTPVKTWPSPAFN
jgi:hypothetical protein